MLETYHTVIVRPGPSGQYMALVLGFPEIRAVAATEQEAIQRVKQLLQEWLANAKLVQVKVPTPPFQLDPELPQRKYAPDDPMHKEYLEILEQFRREDLEQTLREYDQECSDSSSTPTT